MTIITMMTGGVLDIMTLETGGAIVGDTTDIMTPTGPLIGHLGQDIGVKV